MDSLEGAAPSPDTGSIPKLILTWILVTAGIFAICLIGIMTRPAGSLAMVWPANALTLGLLLRMPADRRAVLWLSAPLAFVAADLATGSDLKKALLLNAANLCGVAAGFAASRFIPKCALDLHEPQSVLWHILVAVAGASSAGLFAVLTDPFPLGLSRFGAWTFWFSSELVNYIALLPLIVSMPPIRSLIALRPSFAGWRNVLPVTALIGACALAMYAGGPGAIAFAVPALIWCGLTYPVFLVCLFAFAFATWSLTVIGGDYLHALAGAHDDGAIVSLRLAAFMIALAPITLAIVTRNRGELARKLASARRRVDLALQAGGIVGTWELEVATQTMTLEATDSDSRMALYTRQWSLERALANVHPDDRKHVRDELDTAIAMGSDFYCRYKDVAYRDTRWFAAFGKPVFDQHGTVSRLTGVFIDLTEQAKAAEALELSNKRFNIVSASVPDIVWSSSPDGRHDYFNRRWHEFTGIAPDDADPQTWTRLVHPDDERRVMETWSDCLRTGAPYSIDYRFRHHDGSYRWLRVQAKPLRNAQNVIVRWYGTATDINDAKQLEAEREAVARELDHRIGNLFALMNGLVNVSVREGGTVQAVAEAIRGRLEALHEAHSLIRRSATGNATSMAELLRTLLRPYDDGSGRISVTGDDVEIAAFAVTPVSLVFHELATNAVKYGALRDGKGVLRVTLERYRGRLVIGWKEDCASPSPASTGTGFGSRLFTTVIEGQLRGTAIRTSTPEGLVIDMNLPLSSLVAAVPSGNG